MPLSLALLLAVVGMSIGCVQRKLTITSDPSGAVVTLNDREIGRTPIETDFIYYGKYDVQVRKEGYETFNKGVRFNAPWWQYIPIDFFAEFMPWHPTDHQYFNFVLKAQTLNEVATPVLLERATVMKGQLESTRMPSTTQASTQPATQSSTQPTTQPTTAPVTRP